MIHVVFLKIRFNFLGGLEKVTHHLIQAFAAKGCKVTLLTTGEAKSLPHCDVISLAPASKFTLYHLTHFDTLSKKWLAKHSYDIAFGMERTTFQTHYRAGNGVHAVYLKRRRDVDSYFKRFFLPLNPLHHTLLAMEKKAFEDPALKVLFTNSFMVRNEILNTYSTSATKIEVVHNGVEWHKWQNAFDKTVFNQQNGPYTLLFVGNGYKRKGLHFLLQGLEPFKNKDFHLTVIGKEKNPSFFINLAKKLNLQDKISFLGVQSNILPFYQASDALIIPSIYDPFANVTVEALAMGLYVVSSAYNGGKEVLKKQSGTVIENLIDPSSVSAALEEAFLHPKTEASAQNIRQSIKELDFSSQLDKIIHKTIQTM